LVTDILVTLGSDIRTPWVQEHPLHGPVGAQVTKVKHPF